jgi:ribosomal protein S18 acetylase RimI-like enzyme
MVQNLKFRPFSPSDLDQCLAIFDSNCPKFFAANERDKFLKYLTQERLPYFVVTDGDQHQLACGGFIIDEGVGELAWGMVRSDIQHQGIGRYLFIKRLAEITKSGAKMVIMDTSQHSLGFYESLGFRVVRKQPEGYGPDLDRFDLQLLL